MRLIKIKKYDNGAHDNITADYLETVPEGWAVIPEHMACENFPFGEVEVENIKGVMTVTRWTPGEIPEPAQMPEPDPTADELMDILLGVSEYE